MKEPDVPIDTRTLFQPLDHLLIDLLKSLKPEDWNSPTVAKAWTVKDVASHLLDGNLRTLSIQRDRYFGEQPPTIHSYSDTVAWLNQLNADWVKATKRLSPGVLTMLLELTGDRVSDYYAGLDPGSQAIFGVDWAGESQSLNWMHVAREYTERWHHQQQIRDAIGDRTILTREYFYPVIDTFFRALPHTFREVDAPEGTVVRATVWSEAGGNWYVTKKADGWELSKGAIDREEAAAVEIPVEISWKLFSKSWRASDVKEQVKITGDINLASQVLEMVAVMA